MDHLTREQIRQLVRSAIAAELAGAEHAASERGHERDKTRSEVVRVAVASDEDLMAFARRVLTLAGDPEQKRRFDSGQLRFELARPGCGPGQAPAGNTRIRIDQGLITERMIDELPPGTTQLALGKKARMTPLARDRVRELNIRLERV